MRESAGCVSVTLPESGVEKKVRSEYLNLAVVPLSKEERRLWWNKTVVEFEGKTTLAEIAVRELLEKDGYEAVWVTGANSFTKLWPKENALLPAKAREWYERIVRSAADLNERVFDRKGKGGCWDVLGCRGEEIIFVEVKRRGKDTIKDSQRVWLEAGLNEGLPLSSFIIVEWG